MEGIRGIHHVAIICCDIERSRRFYCELLGFAVIAETFRTERKSHKVDLLIPDGTRLELFTFPDSPPRPSYPEARGLRHLAFRVRDLDSVVVKLRSAGVLVEDVRIDELTGARFTFFADPDNTPLELYEDKAR